tara:strand:- start:1883 stop:2023 length:141 start_codon:yes stop_codon:yes gene_type:complete
MNILIAIAVTSVVFVILNQLDQRHYHALQAECSELRAELSQLRGDA